MTIDPSKLGSIVKAQKPVQSRSRIGNHQLAAMRTRPEPVVTGPILNLTKARAMAELVGLGAEWFDKMHQSGALVGVKKDGVAYKIPEREVHRIIGEEIVRRVTQIKADEGTTIPDTEDGDETDDTGSGQGGETEAPK